MLDDLYCQLILDYSHCTNYFGELQPPAAHTRLDNPLCGDVIDLWVHEREGRVVRIGYEIKGCTICRASAAIMAEQFAGAGSKDIEKFVADFRQVMEGGDSSAVKGVPEKLLLLEGVKKFPARIRCALLPLEALSRVLLARQKGT